jgi:hypothetical protein
MKARKEVTIVFGQLAEPKQALMFHRKITERRVKK